MFRIRLLALGGLSTLLVACGPSGTYTWAQVERVERACEYTETQTTTNAVTGSSTSSQTARKLDCSSDPAFLKIKHGDRSKRLKGKGTAIVRYVGPQDRQSHQAWVKFDAYSDDFYKLEAGQKVYVRIDAEDPSIGYL